MEKLAARLRQAGKHDFVSCAYLEITRPSIQESIDRFVQKGAKEVLVLPYFLLMGYHTKFDIPKIVSAQKKKYRQRARIKLCPYLGYHEKIVSVVQERLREAK